MLHMVMAGNGTEYMGVGSESKETKTGLDLHLLITCNKVINPHLDI